MTDDYVVEGFSSLEEMEQESMENWDVSDAVSEVDEDYVDGYIIDIKKLPKGVRFIKVSKSY